MNDRRFLFAVRGGELLFVSPNEMYSSSLNSRDRGGAALGALAIQLALIIVFLNIAGKMSVSDTQPPLRLVDLPKPMSETPVETSASTPKEKAGGSANTNIKTRASSLVRPKPLLDIPRASELTAAPRAQDANEKSEGNSVYRGNGTGSGGNGDGNGEGSGAGIGNGGGMVEPPHLATPVLTTYDFSREIIMNWPQAATVFLRLRIDARGYVSECVLDRGTNVPAIDAQMCNIAHERLRFRPALNRSGQAVAGWFGYAQPAPR